MLRERIEAKWIHCFERVLRLCAVKEKEEVAILSETQSRAVNVNLVEIALLNLGAKPIHLIIPTPPLISKVPIRSTGATNVIQNLNTAVSALSNASFVVDCTVEGMLHAPELSSILRSGARILMISNEHPETLERLEPTRKLENKVKAGIKRLRTAKKMTVKSNAGTNLDINLEGAAAGGGWGYVSRGGVISHWPGGLCLCFPAEGTVNGTLVLDSGDVNLTFKRYLEKQICMTIVDDFVTKIEGTGLDAELIRSYFSAWEQDEAYGVSHVGWGMNPDARWDSMAMYDKRDFNGTELRAFAGNFLYSTGANEVANRYTLGHFDLPMRNCTIQLDGYPVVSDGKLQGELV